jgi:virginiamycin B lyase
MSATRSVCRRGLPGLGALLGIALVGGLLAAQAHAYVYWSHYNTTPVGRANLDGTGGSQSFVGGTNGAAHVAIDGQYVYWASYWNNAIGRANLDGSGINPSFIVVNSVTGVAVDGQHIYWSSYTSGAIGRANLDGSGANTSFIAGASHPYEVAVDGRHIYWVNGNNPGTIGRANLDGTSVNQSFITGANNPSGLAVDSQHIYWTNGNNPGTIGRANLDGTGANENLITGASAPFGIAVDATYIYWVNASGNTIGRANLDGTSVNQAFIAAGTDPQGVAVDGGPPGTASANPGAFAFDTQPLGTLGAPKPLVITNTGHGNLQIGSARVSGINPDDFLDSFDACTGSTLAAGASCTIDARFGPSATGPRSATLTITSNDPLSPLQVALSGTGGQLPQGPPGQTGATGATGARGPVGPTGPSGAAVMAVYQTSVTARKVTVNYVMTYAATTTLSVTPPHGHPTTVATAHAKPGLNRIVWNRKLGRRAAARGKYHLTLTCTYGGRKLTGRLTVQLR